MGEHAVVAGVEVVFGIAGREKVSGRGGVGVVVVTLGRRGFAFADWGQAKGARANLKNMGVHFVPDMAMFNDICAAVGGSVETHPRKETTL